MTVINWVTTPKCKDCEPTAKMISRKSCQGCIKYNDKVLHEKAAKSLPISELKCSASLAPHIDGGD